MGSSEKWLSPSKSASSPKSPQIGANDENSNSKKSVSKHFMSTTASKAASPRRRILAERDENSIDPRFRTVKTSIDPHFEKLMTDRSSLEAYDPLKNNDLSPRPKFLRFEPNRRHEILTRVDKDEPSDSSSDTPEVDDDEEIKESEEINRICKDDEYEDEDDEEDGEIEETRRCFRGLFGNFVLILLACAVSTLCICTMNSGAPTRVQRAIWRVKDCVFTMNRPSRYLLAKARDVCGEFEEGDADANHYLLAKAPNSGVAEDKDEETDGSSSMAVDEDKTEQWAGENAEKIDLEMEIDDNPEQMEAIKIELVDNPDNKIEQSTGERAGESEDADENDGEIETKGPDRMHVLEHADKFEPFIIFLVVSIIILASAVVVAMKHSKNKPRNNGSTEEKRKVQFLEASVSRDPTEEEASRKLDEMRAQAPTAEFIGGPSVLPQPSEEEASRKLDHTRVHAPTAEFIGGPSILQNPSNEEASRMLDHTQVRAPTVELLGEVFVGRPSGRRSWKRDEAESSGERNAAGCLHKKQEARKKQEALTRWAVPECSNISFDLMDSVKLTTPTKIMLMKKKGGGEHAPEITPVRRSSRLRGRAAAAAAASP